MSTTAANSDLARYCSQTAEAAKAASYQLTSLDTAVKDRWLMASADALVARCDVVLKGNA